MKNAIFVWGGWEGHEPKKCLDVFAPWLREQGFKVEISNSLDSFCDEEMMKSLDLIVPVWTMGTISREQVMGLLSAIRSGVGIAGWHGGMADSFRNNTEYQFMVGGQFVAHPAGRVAFKVKIKDHEDPITAGMKDFRIESEQYYMHVDPSNKVLATTVFKGTEKTPWIDDCVIPSVWKRTYGKGRVFYTSLGHVAEDLLVPQVNQLVKRGMLWASHQL